MRKIIFILISTLILLSGCAGLQQKTEELQQVAMGAGAIKARPYSALVGGGTGALDSTSVDDFSDGDFSFVVTSDVLYVYEFHDTATDEESNPEYIRPDDYNDEGVHYLVSSSWNDSIIIGDADIEEAELEILDGATVTTSELNVLDGMTDAHILVGDGSGAPTAGIPVITEFIPVGWMVADGTTDPGDLTEEDNIAYRDFAHDAEEELEFMWHAPFNISGTTIKIQVITVLSSDAPDNEEGVSWDIAACSITGNESHDCAFAGSHINVEDTDMDDHAGTQWDILYLGSEAVDDPDAANGFVELTPNAALDNGELVKIAIARDVADSDDTYAHDIGLVGIIIKYKIDFATETY